MVGIVAVFDGHNGAEASEMASKLLFEYFILHTYFLLDATYAAVLKKSAGRLPDKEKQDIVFQVLHWEGKFGQQQSDLERYLIKGSKKKRKILETPLRHTICIFRKVHMC